MQSGAVGMANYGNCLTVHASDEGLHIKVLPFFRFAHPPLFLPWSDLTNRRESKLLWIKNMDFDVGSPPLARMSLSAKVFENEPGQKRL